MEFIQQAVVPVIIGMLASTGLWSFLQKRDTTKSATTKLLMGLAYDKITHLGLNHVARGWIYKDEYEDFRKYLYEPYKELGGNGVAERIMNDVTALPIKAIGLYAEINPESHTGTEH